MRIVCDAILINHQTRIRTRPPCAPVSAVAARDRADKFLLVPVLAARVRQLMHMALVAAQRINVAANAVFIKIGLWGFRGPLGTIRTATQMRATAETEHAPVRMCAALIRTEVRPFFARRRLVLFHPLMVSQ
jgi:hypothetical protein